ncbi:GH3 auxin-responsive promoter family protein [Bacteroidetes bacterium endosymbiont of Geopemphigus sp.]|uniref:GH3 auxin-responsive promoter family protein n=1 Tax=Bacteroidetes bacterium endosymbiont of Geopemphigus sp. TaxID=2047937 RepID=UPI000CD15AD8|nr:GH3 auxin-responsive promoter family protein [Bacteroidetes bacterium endosymbiont of Geopemphigus sp.]
MTKNLMGSFVRYFMKRRSQRLKKPMRPLETQNQLLLFLLQRARNTEFGRIHGFQACKSYREFSRRVPLFRYEDITSFIERMRKGEPDILWPGRTKWFAKSSGTTDAKSKFIPVTKDALYDCHYKAGTDMVALYVKNHPKTGIFLGKGLRLGGSHELYESYGTLHGDLSSIILKNLPFWANACSTPVKKVVLMSQWEAKLKEIIDQTIHQDVRSLFGVPSWMLVLLNKLLERSEKTYLDEVWPSLEVFFHGGISFKPYINQYNNLFQRPVNYYETYNASEGFFAFQDQSEEEGMLLLLNHGIFYEFIPMEEFYDQHPAIISIEEVKINTNYAMVISTNAGLWRYIIGDTVRFVSISPYRIIISGRTKHYINSFGEELIIENAESALTRACLETGAVVHEYTVGPIYMDRNSSGAHEWIVEFERYPSDMERFREVLDNTLKALNSDYEAKRYKDITLLPPVIQVAKKGLFYRWLKIRSKLGGQHKVPRLANDRKYLESLLHLSGMD